MVGDFLMRVLAIRAIKSLRLLKSIESLKSLRSIGAIGLIGWGDVQIRVLFRMDINNAGKCFDG